MRRCRRRPSLTWGWFRYRLHTVASSVLHEPPYAEPHVRWCGRTAGVTPPPTRSKRRSLQTLTEGVLVGAVLHVVDGHDDGEIGVRAGLGADAANLSGSGRRVIHLGINGDGNFIGQIGCANDVG